MQDVDMEYRGNSSLDEWFAETGERGFEYRDVEPDPTTFKYPKVVDGLVGLRCVGEDFLRKLLNAKMRTSEELVKNAIKAGPKMADQNIFFPFVVYEAKGPHHSFNKIERQTGLPIRELLRMQFELREKSLPESETFMEPLVWFFGSTATEWRLWICYVEGEKDKLSFVRPICMHAT
jgi:hypothetical protein